MLFRSGLKSLKLIGHFESISSIKEISGQIESLEVCDYSKKFDFYELNRYEFAKLDRFNMYSNRRVYINGCDCDSLYNVSCLGLYTYDKYSEILFDGFGAFTKLKSFSLYYEDVAELDYYELAYKTPLERLEIKAPSFLSTGDLKTIKHQIGNIATVSVRYDDDPYGFAETDE